MTSANDLIAAERQRQISKHGYTCAHDDAHVDGEIMHAGIAYYHHHIGRLSYDPAGIPLGWPFPAADWKPRDPQSNLARAGALLEAEEQRLLRLGQKTSHIGHKLKLVTAALNALLQDEAAKRDKGHDTLAEIPS